MSQTKSILEYLIDGGRLSPITALNLFGCFRLGARICDLRHQGYEIDTTLEPFNGGNHGVYSMTEKEQKRVKQLMKKAA